MVASDVDEIQKALECFSIELTQVYSNLRRGDLELRRIEAGKFFRAIDDVPEFLRIPRENFEISADALRGVISLGARLSKLVNALDVSSSPEHTAVLRTHLDSLVSSEAPVTIEQLLANLRSLGVGIATIRGALESSH